ncbi:hypothetical protein D3C87_279180 [compost metagenome]
MKYVIGRKRNEADEIEFHAAIFGADLQYHREEFEKLQLKVPGLKFFGAAHCDLDYDKMNVSVRDKSEGYGTKANFRDQEILTKLFKEDKLHEQ